MRLSWPSGTSLSKLLFCGLLESRIQELHTTIYCGTQDPIASSITTVGANIIIFVSIPVCCPDNLLLDAKSFLFAIIETVSISIEGNIIRIF